MSLLSDANVRAITATGDTALTYACENGHTDVADVLLAAWADLVSFKNTWYSLIILKTKIYLK